MNTRRLKLDITCDPGLTDAISDYLVGVYDAGIEVGIEDEQQEHHLQVFLDREDPTPDEIEDITNRIVLYLTELAEIFGTDKPDLSSSLFGEEDWSRNWKVHFKPFSIIPGLVIKPSWEEYVPEKNEKVIEMDPGMAFGTGHHATTSLCMEHIKVTLAECGSKTVLDVGTGTGILAMAASLWGATDLLGIDNDPVAVEAARENVKRNGLGATVKMEHTPLDEVQGKYDLVIANIIHDVLIFMEKDLARLTAPSGTLILSGILAGEQAENITDCFTRRGFSLVGERSRGEWSSLRFSR